MALFGRCLHALFGTPFEPLDGLLNLRGAA
jgi:hypothetical protein